MARVTEQDVLDHMNLTTVTREQMRPHLDFATLFVDNNLAGEYTDAELAMQEKLIAAHSYTVMDPEVSKEKIGEAELWLNVAEPGQGFEATSYGRQAMVLDNKGIMKEISTTKEAVEINVVELDIETTADDD